MSRNDALLGTVYRCAWCSYRGHIGGGMPFYAYSSRNGQLCTIPADPRRWARTDGICPAHLRAMAKLTPGGSAAGA
jgi:hypothetical protein